MSCLLGCEGIRLDRVLISIVLSMFFAGSTGAMVGAGGGESSPFANAGADASANFFTGAASVRVPIELPPGRQLTTPTLALGYSSQGGLSAVGFGWAFPIGAVRRATNRGVPTCDAPEYAGGGEGVVGGVDMNRYVVSLSASVNELVETAEGDYLLKVDEGYSVARPDRAGNLWTVRTREGITYTFGNSVESRVFTGMDVFHDRAACAFTTAWHLTRVEDPNGNHIDIRYAKHGNLPIPIRIEYGGNAEVGIPHAYRVVIENETLADLDKPLMRSFGSGVEQVLSRRVKTIRVEGRPRVSSTWQEIRRYTLHYDDSSETQDFFLTSVEGTGLPTRRFEYSTSQPTIVDSLSEEVDEPGYLGIDRKFGPTMSLMDLNGDGLLDRLCVNSGSWHAAYGDTSELQFAAYEACDRSAGNWSVPSISGVPLNRIQKMANGQDRFLTLDLTGDGLPDLVRRHVGSDRIHVYPGRCASAHDCGFASSPEVWNNPGALDDAPLRKTVLGNRGLQLLSDLIDMNGDGLPDLVRADAQGDWEVYSNTGQGFASDPIVHPAVDSLIAYTSFDGVDAQEERALIDVNSDGLPDWISAPAHDRAQHGSRRIPRVYFAVDPAGGLHGPHFLEGGPYLCPTGNGYTQAVLCGSPATLPSGWAIVGAAAVRLNTGSGFAPPVYSPAPFWRNANRSANRLRGTWRDSSSKQTHVYRDFVDVNGDGRVDWVTTGYAYDGSRDWFVLYNLGEGRFGGALDVVEPASSELYDVPGSTGLEPGVFLGEVRPASVLRDVGSFLGRSFQHTDPGDRSDLQMTIVDIDADGLPERVKSFGIGMANRWEVKALRFEDASGHHVRPRLLTRIDDGIGGETTFRYAPSSLFIGPPEERPGLPFVTWVVTGTRRTDGLCDELPSDWFSLDANPCLAHGHERVQEIDYAEGFFDPVSREFRGFGTVRVLEGPRSIGHVRRLEFLQDDVFRGKLHREEVYVGGRDLLSRTNLDWRAWDDGVRTQIYVQEQRVEEFALYAPDGDHANRCIVHRNSILTSSGTPDPKTRVQRACSMACVEAGESDDVCDPAPVGKKQVETSYAQPSGSSGLSGGEVWDRPARIEMSYVDPAGGIRLSSETEFRYDGLPSGFVARGNPTLERKRISSAPDLWAERFIEYDGGAGEGPGNITSMLVPVDVSREPTTYAYDPEFSLHLIAETSAAVTDARGQPLRQRIERETDFRFGAIRKTIGILGEAAGDVSGTEFDLLGRPVCEFEPGTSCDQSGGSDSLPTRELEYHYADPTAAAPLARLNSVIVRRHEPNAPEGHLETRSYWDALGREWLTTNEQSGSDGGLGNPGRIERVVVRHFEYGPSGAPSRRFEPYVASTSLTLEAPAGTASTRFDYSLNGNPEGFLDPAGRVHRTTRVDGSTPKTFYYASAIRSVDGLESASSAGNSVLETLDEHGRRIRREIFEGASSQLLARFDWVYDGRDRVVEEWFGGDSSTRITKTYDGLGRLVETRDPDSGLWRRRYDAGGNLRFVDDPVEDQSVQSCYDALDRIVLQCARASDEEDPGLCSSASPVCSDAYRYVYDEDPMPPDASEPGGAPTHGLGQLTRVLGDASTHRYSYDVRRRVTQRVDRIVGVEATTRYVYARGLDRLLAVVYPDGERVVHGYDVAGQPDSLFEVDDAGRLRATYVSEIAYDLRGRPLTIRRGNYTQDWIAYHGPEENSRIARIRSERIASNPEADADVFLDLEYPDYDGNGRVRQIVDRVWAAGPTSMSAVYGYDGAGRLTSVHGPNPEQFEYDARGNMTASNGRAIESSGHRAIALGDPAQGGWSMRYDANGQRTSKRRSDGSVTQSYAFDAFGRLRTLSVDGSPRFMSYDHTGQRIAETGGGMLRRFFGRESEAVGGRLTKFYFIGDQLLATRTDPAPSLSGTPTGTSAIALPPEVYWCVVSASVLLLGIPLGRTRRRLGLRVTTGEGIGAALIPLTGSLPLALPMMVPVVLLAGCADHPSIRHYHLNHLGSPVAISRLAGEVDRLYRYSAFGEVRRYDASGTAIGPDPDNRREFAGYQSDPESGLQYAGARFYDPMLAQFLSLDPAEQFASPYSYSGWDPVNRLDPDGRAADWIAYGLLVVALALVLANAVAQAVRTGSAGVFFRELGIGVAALYVGYLTGFVFSVPPVVTAVVGIGGTSYALASVKTTEGRIFAGIGLAAALVGSAYGFYRSGAAGADGSDALGLSEDGAGGSGTPPREFREAPGGAEVAGSNDSNLAAIPGRALVRLNNDRINAGIAKQIQDLRARAIAGEFEGLDVAAFEVRTTHFERDLGVNRIVTGGVEVVARPPGTAGFPHDFAPKIGVSAVGTVTTVSPPILIRSELPVSLIQDRGVDLLFRRGIQ